MATVRFENVSKSFGETSVINDISFEIKDGELITLLGPSGCGKSTTLKMIAGLLNPSRGKIFFDSRRIDTVPSNQRNIGLVFQNYALFPHMTVFQNVAFGLEMKKTKPDVIARRVDEVLRLVHMEEYQKRKPAELSGGQQQRVAIARALAFDPDVLLLDEPLSNLDAKLRESVRLELRAIQKETGKTTIFVTHDQIEALTMSDRIFLMNSGKIEQEGSPLEVYNRPRSIFSADFIGSNNFIDGLVKEVTANEFVLQFANQVVRLPKTYVVFTEGIKAGIQSRLCIRPESIKWCSSNTGTSGVNFRGKVLEKIFMGGYVFVYLNIEDAILKFQVDQNEAAEIEIGQNTAVSVNECILLPRS
ncbi:MAG TPA: ABC transporter ATP-binding protein [Bacillota bacterium]